MSKSKHDFKVVRSSRSYFLVLVLGVFVGACDSSRVYDDFTDFDEAFWHMDSVQRFSFVISDTSTSYDLYATFRNASSYPYYNIYFQYSLKDSVDRILNEELKDYDFFDAKTGKPFGSGLGDLFDHMVLLEEDFFFNRPGTYSIELQQYMRLDTLPFILSVGARVEKSESDL